MDVLTLTTNADAPFLNQQQAALEERGVTFETLSVPGSGYEGRTPLDYLRFFPTVVAAARDGYDLVHAHYGLTAPMALAQRRLPVVLSLWGSDLLGSVEPISRACVPFCEEVIVMSEEMRARLGRKCPVIPDGVDLERFQPMSRDDARAAVGWSDDAYHVLFPYSPDRTMKNYPRARRVVTAVDGLFDRPVRLQPVYGVSHDAVSTYMNAADALLLTSLSEGSPNSVKEALACNLPVVSLDVGDVRERLAGVSPSLVATSDEGLIEGLRRVLESGERSNGREAAREVSIDRTTEALLEVYERVIGASATASRRSTPRAARTRR
ncbi:glycosyltransferase [Natrialbaceae archaeon AArc-T1-2]|uniref:glycosyltransferase n=1 Tax=Natrialbaceae archaeon AArc-T1-2 TaxID=3053904 RepID=UPI00255B359E|nr:glycosyltransferase [Natrialbaceae archaeon AArc-T1-2]WIV66176.1 glycosyltransferase [Natrialbaceae archaeon AArc-T1-2]